MISEIIPQAHNIIGSTAFYYAIFLMAWGFWRYFRKQGVDSSFRGALLIEEILILVQGLLGLTMYFILDLRVERNIHILYGVLSALVIPTAFAYTRGNNERRGMLIYAVAALFLVALTLRTLMTRAMLLTFQ